MNASDEYKCVVCLLIIKQPCVHSLCFGMFCLPCLRQCYTATQDKLCPKCRQPIDRDDLEV
jgi:hypothetical protein